MSFTQLITVETEDEEALRDHLASWDAGQAQEAPGYLGSRILADQDEQGRYLIEVDFASQEEAQRNNDRDETGAWAERLRELAAAEPTYRDLRRIYVT